MCKFPLIHTLLKNYCKRYVSYILFSFMTIDKVSINEDHIEIPSYIKWELLCNRICHPFHDIFRYKDFLQLHVYNSLLNFRIKYYLKTFFE